MTLVYLIALAVATIAVLTVGTLGAADMLPHQRRDDAAPNHGDPES